MSPWPTVVIHAVFVEQHNSGCYLLCSRFISENCIVPPFAEWVMECGRKQKSCCLGGLWRRSARLLPGSRSRHAVCRLLLQHGAGLLLKDGGATLAGEGRESCTPSTCKRNSASWSGEHVLGRRRRGVSNAARLVWPIPRDDNATSGHFTRRWRWLREGQETKPLRAACGSAQRWVCGDGGVPEHGSPTAARLWTAAPRVFILPLF